MEEALQSIFGPWVSLIGFGVMILMFAPKVVAWWKRKKAHATSKDDVPNVELETRVLSCGGEKPALPAHPRFGEAAASLRPRRKIIAAQSAAWFLPLIVNLLLPPSVEMRAPLLLLTLPLVFVGIWGMRHLCDSAVFYRTGFTVHEFLSTREIDYNAVTSVRKRTDMNGLASAFILRIYHDSPVSFECRRFFDGARTVARVIHGLPERSVKAKLPAPAAPPEVPENTGDTATQRDAAAAAPVTQG